MHTHRSVMYNTVAGTQWLGTPQDAVSLVVLPLFHVTGMQNGMNGSLYVGATIVLLPRWDRDAAAQLIQRYRVTGTQMIVTMVVDLLSNPRLAEYDLSSICRLSGGGAAMPEAVATRLKELCRLDYIEGYGMSETIAPTHINPPERPMKQCLGIPIFDVDARVVDPATLAELPPGEVGEIIVHGPQVMQGYWGQPQATEAAFVTLDGKRFLRTGDLARTDEHGYFYMVDRIKRMINASGFKVWPAEVEALMYAHPAIQEVCVIAARDERRGETVKAVVVLREAFKGQVSEQEIVDWAHGHMAAYKSPRIVQFADSLPKSGTGKVQWRALQEQEPARTAG
jgi:fatty-acyl-CoA synthase